VVTAPVLPGAAGAWGDTRGVHRIALRWLTGLAGNGGRWRFLPGCWDGGAGSATALSGLAYDEPLVVIVAVHDLDQVAWLVSRAARGLALGAPAPASQY
jgi:hypothetical protein